MSFYNKYCVIAYSSTFLYKLYDTHHIKIKRDNNKITRLLLGEKAFIITCSTMMAPVAFPFIIGINLNKIDNKINKIIDEYERPTDSLFEALF